MRNTPEQRMSMYGNYTVYKKDDLEIYERGLHADGPWFIEPRDWDQAGPYSSGFRSLEEALTQADYWEQHGRDGLGPIA